MAVDGGNNDGGAGDALGVVVALVCWSLMAVAGGALALARSKGVGWVQRHGLEPELWGRSGVEC